MVCGTAVDILDTDEWPRDWRDHNIYGWLVAVSAMVFYASLRLPPPPGGKTVLHAEVKNAWNSSWSIITYERASKG